MKTDTQGNGPGMMETATGVMQLQAEEHQGVRATTGSWGLPCWLSGKESACNAGDADSVGKIPWRRAWQPTPVFLPGESYRERSLTGYSP